MNSKLLTAAAEVLRYLEYFEANVPNTPEWQGDDKKCEVKLGALRKLRQETEKWDLEKGYNDP